MSVDWVRDGAPCRRCAVHDATLLRSFFSISDCPDAEGLDLLKSARRQGVDTPVLDHHRARRTSTTGCPVSTSAPTITCLKPFEVRELLGPHEGADSAQRWGGRRRSWSRVGAELDAETHELSPRRRDRPC